MAATKKNYLKFCICTFFFFITRPTRPQPILQRPHRAAVYHFANCGYRNDKPRSHLQDINPLASKSKDPTTLELLDMAKVRIDY